MPVPRVTRDPVRAKIEEVIEEVLERLDELGDTVDGSIRQSELRELIDRLN